MAEKKDRRPKRGASARRGGGSGLRYGVAGYGWPGPWMGHGLGLKDSDGDGIPDHQDPTPYGGGGAGINMLSGAQFADASPAADTGGGDMGGGGDGGGV